MRHFVSATNPMTASRRKAVAVLAAAPWVWTGLRAQTMATRRLTPAQTEGPFYPVVMPSDTDYDLLRHGTRSYGQGQAIWLEGEVSDPAGQPVRGAQVEIWQCDHAGHYDHPGDGSRSDPAFQGFGRVAVDVNGRYLFRTLRPVAYSGRAPHIHVKVKLDQRTLLTTQLYAKGDAANTRDFLWRNLPDDEARAALTREFVQGRDGLRAKFPIVVAV
jgi:protocatechuate 3,4-dioxygenase, beta subunit